MTIKEFLDTPSSICRQRASWREWLTGILITLLVDGEGFSGKRPNCDSGWQWQLAEAMGEFDPLVYIDGDVNWSRYEELCKELVKELVK